MTKKEQVIQKKLLDYFAKDKKRKLKIGLMGSHDVGKTTLGFTICSKLKTRHYHVEYVAEVARHIPATLKVNEGTNFWAQYWILNEQINSEILAILRGANMIVTDRTVVDNYAYAYRASRPHVKQISKTDLKVMEVKCKHWVRTYDFLFYATIPDKKMEDDGFRAIDKEFQLEIDECLRKIIEDWNLKVVTLEGNNDERLEIMLTTLFKQEF
ncbi:MAG: AAA family ATPase [Candidatus Helarchaeota archaeon]